MQIYLHCFYKDEGFRINFNCPNVFGIFTIWYTRVPNLILVLVYYLPMAAIAAANVFDMWQFSKTATDGLNTHMQ